MFNNNTAANPDGLVQYNWLPLLKLWAPPPLPLFTNPLYPWAPSGIKKQIEDICVSIFHKKQFLDFKLIFSFFLLLYFDIIFSWWSYTKEEEGVELKRKKLV